METYTKAELISRIRGYFGNGGLFNPECMEHDKVSKLLGDILGFLSEEEKNSSYLPKINIMCECRGDGIIDTTELNVIRVERNDDDSYTAVTNHWPTSSNAVAKCPIDMEESHTLCSAGTCKICTDDLRARVAALENKLHPITLSTNKTYYG